MAKLKSKREVGDALASTLAETINKEFKNTNYKVAYFMDGEENTPADVTDFISTGCPTLDLAIANKPNGGFPVGRITEITGLEASGKSLLAAHALAETQKKGGVAVYIDTEAAVSREFLEAIGLDMKRMLYVPLETIEDIFQTIERIIETVRKSEDDSNKLVTIVVDSVMGATTKVEQATEYDKDGYATAKAIILSKGLRKITNLIARERICLIFTNQLRTRLGISFGDPWTTSGGKAIPFHSSVRLRLKSKGQIKIKEDKIDKIVGIKTGCQVIKNRIGPPLKMVEYDIYFDSGIDYVGSCLTALRSYNLITQAGAWSTYTDEETGEVTKFQAKDFHEKYDNIPEFREAILRDIARAYISKYRSGIDGTIDDVIIDTDVIDPES